MAWLPARRWVRMLVQVAILGVIVATAGAVGFIEYSAQPSFCDKCHIMKPYYDSWQLSSHQDVPCIQCHYAPGIKAEAMGKFQAANQVVKYVTGVYGMKPWAEIDDAPCLRSGCHVEARLSSVVDFEGIPFTHAKHLGELRRGKQLRCTSCHSQIVQGSHLAVTRETCILCHFKDRPAGQPLGGCLGCHPAPPRVASPQGFVTTWSRRFPVSNWSWIARSRKSEMASRPYNAKARPSNRPSDLSHARIHSIHVRISVQLHRQPGGADW